jgi:hypothetical protein
MPDQINIERFISSTFRSVWDLELLLELSGTPDESRTTAQLVSALRASDVVVAKGIDTLLAAGLILEEGDGTVRFAPASKELAASVAGSLELYRAKPDAVRRRIIASSTRGLEAFSEAFRIVGDK